MFRKKIHHHHNAQPTGRHIPEMLAQKRKNTGKIKTEFPSPQECVPTTLAILVNLYIRLNYFGHTVRSQKLAILHERINQNSSAQKFYIESGVRYHTVFSMKQVNPPVSNEQKTCVLRGRIAK